jgi:hypothetical protein
MAADLEETVIQQDRQFLSEVARTLGLPVAEVLKRCLGTGSPQIMLIGDEETGQCPWWEKTGLLWHPCGRLRLTATTACHVHVHSKPSQHCCLGSDDQLATIEEAQPFLWKGVVYWATSDTTVREDGAVVPFTFKQIEHEGSSIYVKVNNELG